MARMLSQIATIIRGSVGGITFTKNQFQAIVMRARVAPVNPRTVNQELMRSCLSGAEQLWKNLTQTQRNLWEDYANSLVFTGPTGQYSVPGRQVAIGNLSIAIYLKTRGHTIGALDMDPPVNFGFIDLEAVAPAAGPNPGTGFGVTMTYNGAEDLTIYGRESGPVSLTRKSFSNPFRADTLVSANLVAPASAIIEYTTANPDSNHFAIVRAITAAPPYRISTEYIIQATSATLP